MATVTTKSIASWSLLALAGALLVSAASPTVKLATPAIGLVGLGALLHAHAQSRGGWDLVSPLAVIGAALFCLLLVGTVAFWVLYFSTGGFAD